MEYEHGRCDQCSEAFHVLDKLVQFTLGTLVLGMHFLERET